MINIDYNSKGATKNMKMEDNVLQVSVDDIIPNRFQPRLAFDEQGLKELASSIKEHGIIQPLVLRKLGSKYEIIAGERRYKASIMAGLTTVPAVISNIDDNSSAEIALVENIQRRNLTPIEEARSYKNLLDKGYTQEQLAQKMGISQSSVANKLRLLNLDESVQQALLEGKISERHARSLLVLNDAEKEKEWLNRIITERLTVRQLDQELKKIKEEENKADIPLVDLSFNADDIKNNSFDINKKPNKLQQTDDILKDYSEESAEDTNTGNNARSLEKPNVEIIDTLQEPVSNNSDILTNPYEVPNKTTFFETLEPLAPEEQAKQNVGNKGYFSFNFEQPDEPAPVKKNLEVLEPQTPSTDNSASELLSEPTVSPSYSNPFNDNFDNAPISGLNPNNKFFTPINNNQEQLNSGLNSNLNKPDEEELFDPMSLLGNLTNDTPSSNKEDLETAKKDIEDVINNLKLQGFKVDYSFENKENGCKITIDVD